MRHRQAEVAAIVNILQADDYESAEDMAKAIIAKVYDQFKARDTWHGLKWGALAYGPWIDRAEANRAAASFMNLPTVHQLYSVASFEVMVEKSMGMRNPKYCPECEHPTFAHGFSNHQGCVVRNPVPCRCRVVYK